MTARTFSYAQILRKAVKIGVDTFSGITLLETRLAESRFAEGYVSRNHVSRIVWVGGIRLRQKKHPFHTSNTASDHHFIPNLSFS